MQPNDPRTQYQLPDDRPPQPYPLNGTQMPDFMLDAPRPAPSRRPPVKLIIVIVLAVLALIIGVLALLLNNAPEQSQQATPAATNESASEPYGLASNTDVYSVDWTTLTTQGWTPQYISSSALYASNSTQARAELDVEQRTDASDSQSDREATEQLLQDEYTRAGSNGGVVTEPKKTSVWVAIYGGGRVEFRLWEYSLQPTEGQRVLVKRLVRVMRSHTATMTYSVDSSDYDDDEWNTLRSELELQVIKENADGTETSTNDVEGTVIE